MSFFPLIQPISLCLGWQPHQSWLRFLERWAKWQFWRQKRRRKKGVLKGSIELCLSHNFLLQESPDHSESLMCPFFAQISRRLSFLRLRNSLKNGEFLPINNSGSIQGRHAPYEEKALAEPIKWHPTNNEIRKRFQHGKSCKNHPINQPFSIVFFVAGL